MFSDSNKLLHIATAFFQGCFFLLLSRLLCVTNILEIEAEMKQTAHQTHLHSQTHFQSFSLLTAFYNYITRKAERAFHYLCSINSYIWLLHITFVYLLYIKSRL